MPLQRFLAYANQIPALQAEETLNDLQAVSFPHLEKRQRKQALRQLEIAAGVREPITRQATRPRMVGELPADVAKLKALESQFPQLRGMVQVTRKKDKKDDVSHTDGPANGG